MSQIFRNRKLLAFTAVLPLTLAIAAGSPASQPMAPTDAEAATTTLVYGLLSDSRYAYRPRKLDDQLSAEIFRRYFDSLDSDKLFFTAGDMSALAKLICSGSVVERKLTSGGPLSSSAGAVGTSAFDSACRGPSNSSIFVSRRSSASLMLLFAMGSPARIDVPRLARRRRSGRAG